MVSTGVGRNLMCTMAWRTLANAQSSVLKGQTWFLFL